MEWKPITLPADSTSLDQNSSVVSWQGTGARGNYTLTALTSQFFVGSKGTEQNDTSSRAEGDNLNSDAVISYLITGPVSTYLESAVRVSSDGNHKWMSKAEYQVPASDLLVTAKAFCESGIAKLSPNCEVNGEFPSRRTWKQHSSLYLDVVAGKATPPLLLVAEDMGDMSEDEDEEESEESRCESARILLWSEKTTPPSAEQMRAAAAMLAIFDEPTDDTAEAA